MAEHGLLEIELQVITQVGTAKHLLASAAAASTENISKDVAEDVAERVGRAVASAGTTASGETFVAVLIVDGALLRVGQHLISFLALFEFLFGFRVVGIAVGVKLHRQTAISLLDLGLRGRACQ